MSALLAAAGSAGGAPVRDVLIVGGASTVLSGLVLLLVLAYRRGGAPRFRRLLAATERWVGVPGWASVPALGAIAFALLTIWGATWDIGLHIDVGRDQGPLGTTAHYPLLFGLLGMFLMGMLAVGIAPSRRDGASAVAIRVPGVGLVPASAILLCAASAFAMAGFPLDDLWHRVFGQDVTLWGPTHTMFIGGILAAGCGAALLLAEGARAAGREPFRRLGPLRNPIAALLAGIFLYFWTATLHEFNWGVPQYREVWHPMLLAFGGAHAMVLARLLSGRGGTLGPLAVWLPMQVAMSLVIGGPLHTTMPALPLFLAEAAIIELLGARGTGRSPVRFGVLAGVGVGTLGFAAEYAWTHVVYPVPWTPGLLPEAIPVALAAAVAGGVLGALMAQALRGTLPAGRRPLALAVGAAAVMLALAVNAGITTEPTGLTARITLENPRPGPAPGGGTTTVADVGVRLNRPRTARHANWLYVMAWQGGGRYAHRLVRRADGTLGTAAPVPIGGHWKSFVRLQKGRALLAAPIRMPRDRAAQFAGVRAAPQATRPLGDETRLLQTERKKDGPLWAWTPAMSLVLLADLALFVLMGAICVRVGRLRGRAPTVEPPDGVLLRRAEEIFAAVERRTPTRV